MNTTTLLHFVARSHDPVEPIDYCTRELARFAALSPEKREAEEAEWQAESDAEYAAWLASGEPDLLAELMAKRAAERVTAEAESDALEAWLIESDDTLEAMAEYDLRLADWHARHGRLFPQTYRYPRKAAA